MWLYLVIGIVLGVLLIVALAFASLLLPVRKGKAEGSVEDLPEVDWRKLCQEAASEQDLQKLLSLTDRINRQLEQKRHHPQSRS